MVDCKHVEYDMDGAQCKIDACKGYQCRHNYGEDCEHYEPKNKKEKKKKKKEGKTVTQVINDAIDIALAAETPAPTQSKTQNTTTQGTSIMEGSSITVNPPMSYGWICPKCGRVNAPWKSTCDCYQGGISHYEPCTPHTPYYNPPIETPNPSDPYSPYRWGDAPGWWQHVPTCQGGGLGNPIPCGDSSHLGQDFSNTISISKPNPNIKIWNAQAQETK